MNEPCRHERALTAQPGWVQGLTKMEAERDEALATIGRLDEDVAGWISRAVDAEAIIERVRALLGDTAGPLWSVRGVREADLCAALEATS